MTDLNPILHRKNNKIESLTEQNEKKKKQNRGNKKKNNHYKKTERKKTDTKAQKKTQINANN